MRCKGLKAVNSLTEVKTKQNKSALLVEFPIGSMAHTLTWSINKTCAHIGEALRFPTHQWVTARCWSRRTSWHPRSSEGWTGRSPSCWCHRPGWPRWRCGSNSVWWSWTSPGLLCPRSAAEGTQHSVRHSTVTHGDTQQLLSSNEREGLVQGPWPKSVCWNSGGWKLRF